LFHTQTSKGSDKELTHIVVCHVVPDAGMDDDKTVVLEVLVQVLADLFKYPLMGQVSFPWRDYCDQIAVGKASCQVAKGLPGLKLHVFEGTARFALLKALQDMVKGLLCTIAKHFSAQASG
jgi:hypothetical protein